VAVLLWHCTPVRVLLIGASIAARLTAPAAEALHIESAQIDGQRAAAGLRARVGADLDAWTIRVDDHGPSQLAVTLTRDDGRVIERTLRLTASDIDERSRELAAALAVLIDAADAPDEAANDADTSAHHVDTAAPTPAKSVRPWIGAGPHLGVGRLRAPSAEIGLSLLAGVGLFNDHLHPLLGVTYSVAPIVDAHLVRIGVGLAAGAPLRGRKRERLWFGGGALPQALWLGFGPRGPATSIWSGAGQLFAIARLRAPSRPGRPDLQVMLRSGADLTLPPLRIHGESTVLRGSARWFGAIELGVAW
jgi:hypothetical protein